MPGHHDRPVRGIDLEERTRCGHYGGYRDVVAIRLPCCRPFYACIECHEVLADHAAERWPPDDHDVRAVRCGHCGAEIAIEHYLAADHACPRCGGPFNPGCANHYDRYFELRE